MYMIKKKEDKLDIAQRYIKIIKNEIVDILKLFLMIQVQ